MVHSARIGGILGEPQQGLGEGAASKLIFMH